MTMTMPPNLPGSRRALPVWPSSTQEKAVRTLLEQGELWIVRPRWEKYLRTGDLEIATPIDGLTKQQVIAILSWLRQQQHELHRVVEGSVPAPDGWLESLPLHRAFNDRSRSAEQRTTPVAGLTGWTPPQRHRPIAEEAED